MTKDSLIDLIKFKLNAKAITNRMEANGFRWVAVDELFDLIRQHEAYYGGYPDAKVASGLGSKEQPSTNTSEISSLFPCPFCGGEARYSELPSGINRTTFEVCCINDCCKSRPMACHIASGVSDDVLKKGKQAAVSIWNTRHTEPVDHREICDANVDEIADYLWRKMQPGEAGLSRDMIAKEMRPYLRTTEPVDIEIKNDRVRIAGKWFYAPNEPVSLEVAAKAMSDRDPPCKRDGDGICAWEETNPSHQAYCREDAESCAKAWGLSYVD